MTIYLVPSGVDVTVRAGACIAFRPPVTVPELTPVPFVTRSFIPDPCLLKAGWPYVPDIWVHADTAVTCDGTTLDSTRPDPSSAPPVGNVRFIANEANYTAVGWFPYYSSQIDYHWTAGNAGANAPLHQAVTYLVGKELMIQNAYTFRPGSYLFSSFNSGLDQSQNLGMAMVVMPQVSMVMRPMNTTQDRYPLFYIPNPDLPGAALVAVYVSDTITLAVADPVTHKVTDYRMTLLKSPMAMVPMYLFFLYTTSGITLYIGTSMNRLTTLSVPFSTPRVLPLNFYLGTDNLVGSSGSFHLFDITLFDPTDLGVVGSMLTSVYGTT